MRIYQEVAYFNYIPGELGYDISQKSFTTLAKNKIILVDGWKFVDSAAVQKHAETIRKIFKPNYKYLNNVERFKKTCYSNYDIVIGVHIRRTDYATFNDGKWFYTNIEYSSFMRQIILLPSFRNKKVGFLLCSDEVIDPKDFEDLPTINSDQNFIEDLYSLAFCDLIIGPPSTFSSWASFYGKKQLLHITDKKMPLSEAAFKTGI
jgi:hypothetical protein